MVNFKITKPHKPARHTNWDWPQLSELEREFMSPLALWMRSQQETLEQHPFSPKVDIIENDDSWVFKAELPDVDIDDILVTIEEGVLSIKGERRFEDDVKEGNFTRFERHYGSFERRFSLPSGIDQENIKADMKNGVLTLRIPKKEESKPKAIQIDVK